MDGDVWALLQEEELLGLLLGQPRGAAAPAASTGFLAPKDAPPASKVEEQDSEYGGVQVKLTLSDGMAVEGELAHRRVAVRASAV